MSRIIFRRIEQSHETNLLDDLSKSLEKGGDSTNKMMPLNNLLASYNLNLLDADDLLNDSDDEDMLQMHQGEGGSDSAILNLLDDEINDDDD